jgi:class 3 adenylate cyclase/tetratricopeptide (TPR) repeat protein
LADIAAWLAGLGLQKYAEAFAANEIDLAALPHLTEGDLKELGLPIGPRRKVLAAIAALGQQAPAPLPPGQAAPFPEPAGERRQVTVMFIDLVGFTRLSQKLDAEQVHGLLERYFSCVDRVVAEHGGHVDKHIGDCVMAVFGAPVAHGNDVERAVRAALAARERMAALSAEAGYELRVHTGVAAGQVMASGSGSASHREYTVTGESVNLASRLTDAAAPDEILISDKVWQALGDRLEASDAGLLQVDGFAAPVRAWRVAGFRGRTHLRPMIGRQLEMQQLAAAMDACRETGRGRPILVRGEAGLGKTRLLEETLRIAQQHGFACHVALVLDFGTGAGADATGSLVRDILGLGADAGEPALRAAAETALRNGLVEREAAVFLNDLLGLPQPLELRSLYDAMDNAARTRGKRETAVQIAVRASRMQPRLLAIEDVHWADPFTLANLAALAAAVGECPAILVMTSRLEQDPIDQAWRAQAGASSLITIDLAPLRRDEAQALAAPFFAANEAAAARCVERAGGNPLFLDQLLRLAEDGADSDVPGSVQNLVQARLDRLGSAEKPVVQAASVLGQRFDAEALAYLLGRPGYVPDPAAAQFLIRPHGDGFLFAHALIHEAVYSGLLRSRRRELHRRAAEWFATRDPTLRATHLERAEDPQAPQAYLAAARSEMERYRYETARQLAERGLALATDNADRSALSCLLGDVLLDLGAAREALKAFEDALASAPDDPARCRAWIGCAAVKRITDDLNGAFADLDRAQSVAVSHRLTREEARLRYLRGNLYFPRGDIEGCASEHRLSLELAREAKSAELEAAALGGLGDADYLRARMKSAGRRLMECVDVARRNGFGRIEVANNAQVAHAMLYYKPQAEALEQALAAAAAAARVGHLRAEINARSAAFSALQVMGEGERCRAEVDRTLELIRRTGAGRFEQRAFYHLGKLALAEGRRRDAIDLLERGLAVARRTGLSFHGATVLGGLACARDSTEGRRAALSEGEELIRNGCVAHNQLWFYPDAMEAALELGDYEAVERFAALLEDFTRPEPLPWSDFFIARGRLLAEHGRGRLGTEGIAALEALRRLGEQLGYTGALTAIDGILGGRGSC